MFYWILWCWSFQRRSSQPISWLSTEETKLNTTKANNITTTTTTTVLWPFVRHYPGEPVPGKHSPTHLSWSSSSLYQLLPSTMIDSIIPVQFMCLTIFLHKLSPFTLTSYIHLTILIWSFSSLLAEVPPRFLSWQVRPHFHVTYYFVAYNCYTASLS